MKWLVENVLLTAGVMNKLDSDRATFDVDSELRAAIQAVGPSDKAYELHVEYPLTALGDAERFRMTVEHLLRNADKFSPPQTTVRIDGYDADGEVHVIVSDEGPGIPEAKRDAVFRRFFQVDGSSTRRHGGLGLGLFLARHLAHSMGGALVADPSPVGARLHLRLPAPLSAAGSRRADVRLSVPMSSGKRTTA
jgi:signal transduction histidine kinase